MQTVGSVFPFILGANKYFMTRITLYTIFSSALIVEALQGKTCQDSLLSGEGRSLGAKISGGDGSSLPGEYFFVSTKLDTFCYLTVQTPPCYVPSF